MATKREVTGVVRSKASAKQRPFLESARVKCNGTSNEEWSTVQMSWSGESYVSDDSEPSGLLYETFGTLFNVDDNNGDKELVGRFGLCYVDVGRAVNEGISLLEVLDSFDHTMEYYDPIFGGNDPDFGDQLLKVLDHDISGSNLLILDRLEILPKFRGKGLGLSIMREMMKRFSAGAAVVAIKPFPLQCELEPHRDEAKKWRSEMGLSHLPQNERLATKKLCDYYSKLGFRRLKHKPFMVRSTSWPLPVLQTPIHRESDDD